jgi:glycerol-3-phosphate dehydrogenase
MINKTKVLVVGGGITGIGILRDLALRRITAALIEQGDLAHGASFRFHGLLHSGARYAVIDAYAALECSQENKILQQTAPTCVHPIGGLFMQHASDSDEYLEAWLKGCSKAGIQPTEVSLSDLRKRQPFLTSSLKRAYQVPDGIVDGPRLVWANAYQAIQYGAKIFKYNKLTRILTEGCRVKGAEVTNTLTGEISLWECELLINATGAWVDQITNLSGIELPLVKNKGSLVVFNQRFPSNVLNRLRPPGDGDIIVPHQTATILGTTSVNIQNPDEMEPTLEEIQKLLRIGTELVPSLESYRLLRAYSGVRALFTDASSSLDSRKLTRDFLILDHKKRDGLEGLITLVGGKLTTYRLMAEKTVDYVGELYGLNEPCSTAIHPLVENPHQLYNLSILDSYQKKTLSERYGEKAFEVLKFLENHPGKAIPLCECECVSLGEIEIAASWEHIYNLDDLRRRTRIGMGTCQGLYCSFRSLGAAWESLKDKPEKPVNQLKNFLERRYKGQKTLLWDTQLRESELTLGIYNQIFNLDHTDTS